MNKKKIFIQILSLIGLILTIKLAHIYYLANYERYALSSFCSINDFIDCDGVAKTKYSQVFGIPLAYWGIFFYITVLFLTIVDKLKNIKLLKFLEVFKNPFSYITFLGIVAFSISMVLANISLFKIQKICILCVVTYFIDFLIAAVASECKISNLVISFKETFLDFIDGAKKYTKTCIILFVLAISFVTYSGVSLQFVPHIKRLQPIMKYRDMKKNPYRVKGNLLGSKKSDVVIVFYSDYVCPLCYIHNIMLHRLAKEYKNIRIVHYNYPMDKSCNEYVMRNMHPNACFMSKGAIAAEKQGNYWEMNSLLYENQPNNMASMLKLVKKAKLDESKFLEDFNSKEVNEQLNREILSAHKKNIDATPTSYINGKEYVGVKPYEDWKGIVEEYGAKRK